MRPFYQAMPAKMSCKLTRPCPKIQPNLHVRKFTIGEVLMIGRKSWTTCMKNSHSEGSLIHDAKHEIDSEHSTCSTGGRDSLRVASDFYLSPYLVPAHAELS